MRCTRLFICALFLITLSIELTAAELSYSVEPVMRVEYGKDSSQISASWARTLGGGETIPYSTGVRGLAVDNIGNIYLGDYPKGRVKKFSATGQLLAITEDGPGGPLENMQSFTVDDGGNIIAQSDHFDGSGLTKFDGNGKILWARSFYEIVSRDELKAIQARYNVELMPRFGAMMSAMPGGGILINIDGWEYETNISRRVGIHIDSDGRLVDALPEFGRESGGYLWCRSNWDKLPAATVRVLSLDGTLIKTISLDTMADAGSHFRQGDIGVGIVLPDHQGGVFLATSMPALQQTYLTDEVAIQSDIVLNYYDSDGRFLGEFRMPASPFMSSGSEVAITPDGSIYHLRFDQSGIIVVAYRAQTRQTLGSGISFEGLGGNRVHELTSYRSDNHTLAPMRTVAQRVGYQVRWDAKTRLAELSGKGPEVTIDATHNAVLIAGKKHTLKEAMLFRNSHIWMPVRDFASLLSLPIRLDKTESIAFLMLP